MKKCIRNILFAMWDIAYVILVCWITLCGIIATIICAIVITIYSILSYMMGVLKRLARLIKNDLGNKIQRNRTNRTSL